MKKAFFRKIGAIPIKGFQLRYIYFIDKSYRDNLTVPEIPYSMIGEIELYVQQNDSILANIIIQENSL